MSFLSRPEYEALVYGLLDAYPEIIGSTLLPQPFPTIYTNRLT